MGDNYSWEEEVDFLRKLARYEYNVAKINIAAQALGYESAVGLEKQCEQDDNSLLKQDHEKFVKDLVEKGLLGFLYHLPSDKLQKVMQIAKDRY